MKEAPHEAWRAGFDLRYSIRSLRPSIENMIRESLWPHVEIMSSGTEPMLRATFISRGAWRQMKSYAPL